MLNPKLKTVNRKPQTINLNLHNGTKNTTPYRKTKNTTADRESNLTTKLQIQFAVGCQIQFDYQLQIEFAAVVKFQFAVGCQIHICSWLSNSDLQPAANRFAVVVKLFSCRRGFGNPNCAQNAYTYVKFKSCQINLTTPCAAFLRKRRIPSWWSN